jgi:hypothetical protein
MMSRTARWQQLCFVDQKTVEFDNEKRSEQKMCRDQMRFMRRKPLEILIERRMRRRRRRRKEHEKTSDGARM